MGYVHQIVVLSLSMIIAVSHAWAQTRPAVKTIYAGEATRPDDSFYAEVTIPADQSHRITSTGTGEVNGKPMQWEVRVQPMTIIEQLKQGNRFFPDGRVPTEGAMFELHAWPAGESDARRLVWRKFLQRFHKRLLPEWCGVATWDDGSKQWFIALSNQYGFDVFAVPIEYQPTTDAREYGSKGLVNTGETQTHWGRYFPPVRGPGAAFPGVWQDSLRWEREGDLLVPVNTNARMRSSTRYVLSPAKAEWVKWGEPGKPWGP